MNRDRVFRSRPVDEPHLPSEADEEMRVFEIRTGGASERKLAERTCVACREVAERDALLRLVPVNGQLLVDLRRRLKGRGFSVHPNRKCLSLAMRKNGGGSVDDMVEQIRKQIDRRLAGLIGGAIRARLIVLGMQDVRSASNMETAALVIYARDAAKVEELRASLDHHEIQYAEVESKDALGRCVGRLELAAVSVAHPLMAQSLWEMFEFCGQLGLTPLASNPSVVGEESGASTRTAKSEAE